MKKINLDWTHDEHILALDLYLQYPKARNNKDHPKVIELSSLLNALPFHPADAKDTNFRNPNSISMKLNNFKRCDPQYTGAGLTRGAKLEKEVWDKFSSNPVKLNEIADAIKRNAQELTFRDLEEIDDEEEAAEGRVLTVTHRRRERSKKIVAKKKLQSIQKNGKLECEACGFNFHTAYGERGSGFIECHHERPVSELQEEQKTKISDLRLVCSNCHRIIHRAKPWISIEELRVLLGRS